MPTSPTSPSGRGGLRLHWSRWYVTIFVATIALGAALPAWGELTFKESGADVQIQHTWTGSLGEAGGTNFGGGVAMEDFDGDGDLDVFFASPAGKSLQAFRNEGSGAFTEITDDIGIGDIGTSKQLVFGDLDNNGTRDLVVTGWTVQTRVFSNQGDGTFSDETTGSGLERVFDEVFPGKGTGACLGDYDLDGDLDLYVSYWVLGAPAPGAANRLYRNDGKFKFADVTAEAGVGSEKKSFQALFTDLNGDRLPDLLVAQDKRGGLTYYQNNGGGTFTDRTWDTGLTGFAEGGGVLADAMGLAANDYDNDGDLDVYLTNIRDGNVLYRNDGRNPIPMFEDVTQETGTISERVGWGTGFVDCDNDGWQDLYVVCFGGSGDPASQDNRLYHSLGGFNFTDVGPAAKVDNGGDGFGHAAGDLDNDGYVDMIVTNDNSPSPIYINQASGNHWLRVRLVGAQSNRDGIGAWIFVTPEGKKQMLREVQAGTSYLSHNSLAQDFGLGAATSIAEIEVRWPSGQVDTYQSWSLIDREITIFEGASAPVGNRVHRFLARADGRDVHLSWSLFGDGTIAVDRVLDGSTERVANGQPLQGEWIDRPFTAQSKATYRLVDENTQETLSTTTVQFAPNVQRLTLSEPIPNPFNPRVTLALEVPTSLTGQNAELSIFDVRGRRLRVLFRGPASPGTQSFIWDGTDEHGRAAASGVYRAVASVGTQRRAVGLTLVR